MKTIIRLTIIFLLVAWATLAAPKIKTGQKQPSPERIAEIQTALRAHGYPAGKNWAETKEICRKIADEHGWQNMWSPDTRVLILLGLEPKLDQSISSQPGNVLDQDARKWVEEHGPGKIQ